MNVAVSGASGFIGRHVVAELERLGVGTTRVTRSSPLPSPMPDTLIHLAWAGLPNYRSLHHFEEELPAQYAFLKQCLNAGVRTLVVAGTCFEYGMQSGPLNEQMDTRPAHPYGLAKDTLRRQLQELQRGSPFALTWARLFYLYGDGQAASSLWPQLQAAVARGDALFPMSGGEQLRDYLTVKEVAGYLAGLALAQRDSGIVNVCSGHPISVRRLVEGWIAENAWDIRPRLGHFPYADHEPMAFWGDRHKLDRLLISFSSGDA
jgi:dTDP-6-deoxy-L-talose 4-dehydrogenase (NAD+)